MLTLVERWDSGNGAIGADGYDEYSVIVQGDPDADNADDPETIMLFAIPQFSQVSWAGNPVNNFSRERIAPGTWIVRASFRSPTYNRAANATAFSFTTGGGTQHIMCSRRTVQGYGRVNSNPGGAPVSPPRNFQGAINVSSLEDIGGCDIFVPTFDFRITFYIPSTGIDPNYANLIYACTSRFNTDLVIVNFDGIRLTLQPGELLFLNGDGSKRRGFGDWEFTLNFKAAKSIDNETIAGIPGISARGWDYIWFSYQKQVDGNSGNLVIAPDAAYVEEVYDSTQLLPLLRPANNAPVWSAVTGNGGGGLV